jgi:hypothetical protein
MLHEQTCDRVSNVGISARGRGTMWDRYLLLL